MLTCRLVDHGVHAFLVPIRDAKGQLMPGVEIHDCGYKVRPCSGCGHTLSPLPDAALHHLGG
jgi:hypothetical protein